MMSSLRVKAKRPQIRQSFCSFILFFLTAFEFTDRLREKKSAEVNQTALSVDEILLRASGMPRAGGRHQLPVFFPKTLPQTPSQRPPEVRPGMFTAFVRVISTFRPISVCNQV